ncbi:hypothetical protein LTR95_009146 [Oleoguttula sp. CCFEE 5521]
MHRTIILLAGLSLANAAAIPDAYAPPAVDVDGTRRWFASCVKAPNCEVYIDALGHENIRFKKNMGPGSKWFEDNIMPNMNGTETLVTVRDDGFPLEARGNDAKTDLTRAKKQIGYGDQGPVSVVRTLTKHCITNSCNVIDWTIATKYINRLAQFEPGHLKLHASGIWVQGQRGNFMDAIQALATRHKAYTARPILDSGDLGAVYDQFSGTRFYSVLRHGGAGITGYVTL